MISYFLIGKKIRVAIVPNMKYIIDNVKRAMGNLLATSFGKK